MSNQDRMETNTLKLLKLLDLPNIELDDIKPIKLLDNDSI